MESTGIWNKLNVSLKYNTFLVYEYTRRKSGKIWKREVSIFDSGDQRKGQDSLLLAVKRRKGEYRVSGFFEAGIRQMERKGL